MQTVTSKDHTRIAYEKLGSGAPLVIVGGALADHAYYAPLAEALASYFTVYNFDRRGRGESDDMPPYSIDREVEDVTTIIDLISEPVILYGHSAGSALALYAAAAKASIEHLILADPPFTPRGDNDAQSASMYAEETKKVQELHDSGKHKDNVVQFLSGMGLPTEMIEATLNSPAGASMVASAKALPYDYAMLGDGLVPTEAAEKVKVRTTILAAGYSLDAAKQLANAISGATLKTLENSTHEMAPADLAAVIKEMAS